MSLVIGCNSFVGRSLAKRLLQKGAPVRGMDFWRDERAPEKLEFIEGSVLDYDLLLEACAGVDVVYHLMEVRHPSRYGRRFMKKINVTGTENVIRAALEKQVQKIIVLSTADIYGKPKAIPVKHDDPKKPVSAYGRDKLRAEKICWRYIEKHGADITIFRSTFIAGAGVDDPMILIMLYMALALGDANRLYVAGDGDSLLQMIHPDDVVDAFLAAVTSPRSRGKAYNIGSDNVPTQIEQVVKLKELAKLDCYIKHLNPRCTRFLSLILRPLNIPYLSKEHILGLLSNIVLDCSRAKREINWYPRKDNIDILVETCAWYEREKL